MLTRKSTNSELFWNIMTSKDQEGDDMSDARVISVNIFYVLHDTREKYFVISEHNVA